MKLETELAAHIIKYLARDHFEIYQEVQGPEGTCDLVGKAGQLLWAIECKMTLNFNVIGQARRWTPYAHFASLAVPYVKSRDDLIVTEILDKFGLGLLLVHDDGRVENRMIRDLARLDKRPPRGSGLELLLAPPDGLVDNAYRFLTYRQMGAPFRRRVLPGLSNALHERQKTFSEAGNAGAKRWTPFKGTCEELMKVVRKHPGIELKAALLEVTHHYTSQASARACLSRLIGQDLVPGLSLENVNGKLLLHIVKVEKKRSADVD